MFFRKHKQRNEVHAEALPVSEFENTNNALREENEFLKSFINDTHRKMMDILHNHKEINDQHSELLSLTENVRETSSFPRYRV